VEKTSLLFYHKDIWNIHVNYKNDSAGPQIEFDLPELFVCNSILLPEMLDHKKLVLRAVIST
jgi:hypothetical protein